MPRSLPEIIAHIRAVAGNPAIGTTLIQTEDLIALCDAAERANHDEAEGRGDILKRLDRLEAAVLEINPGLNWP